MPEPRRWLAGVAIAVGLALAVVAAARAAGPPRLPAAAELAVADKTRALVAEKLAAREADLAARVRALYKLTRAGTTPLWADEAARADLVRRRAAAKRLILRDLGERALLQGELAHAEAQTRRLTAELLAQVAAGEGVLPAALRLAAPLPGRPRLGFGPRVDRPTRARVVGRGLGWAAREGAVVAAPLAGRVVWTGTLRSLGPALLIDAGDGVTVLLGGAFAPAVAPGDALVTGAPVGVARGGLVALELRWGGRIVDPTRHLAAHASL